MEENINNNNDKNVNNLPPLNQNISDESEINNEKDSFVLDNEQLKKDNKSLSWKEKLAQKKQLKAQQKAKDDQLKTDKKAQIEQQKKELLAKDKQEKLAKKEARAQKNISTKSTNSRWLWFFILLLIGIILLFMWDTHRKTKFIKAQMSVTDSLKYSEHFYKTKYQEKDSSLSILLKNYNDILAENIESSDQISTNKKELLKLQRIVYLQDSIMRAVKATFDVALGGYAKDQLSVEMKDGKLYITMRDKLLFPSGSELVQSTGLNILKTISKVLTDNSNIDIVIEGHTDNVPLSPKSKLFKDNWDLSTARAVSVTRILIQKYNIRPERLTAAGRSMFYPIAPNTTVEGRAKNRRIEFILTPNLEELYKISENQFTTK